MGFSSASQTICWRCAERSEEAEAALIALRQILAELGP